MKLVISSFLIVAVLLSQKPVSSEEYGHVINQTQSSSAYTNIEGSAAPQTVHYVDSNVTSIQATKVKQNVLQNDNVDFTSTAAITEIPAEASLAINLPNRQQNRSNRAETVPNIMPSFTSTQYATTSRLLNAKLHTSKDFEELTKKDIMPTMSMYGPNSFIHIEESDSYIDPSYVLDEDSYIVSPSSYILTTSSAYTILHSRVMHSNKEEKKIDSTVIPDTNISVMTEYVPPLVFENDTENSTMPIPELTSLYLTVSSEDKIKVSRKETVTPTKYLILVLQKDCAKKDIFPNLFAVLNTNILGLLSTGGSQNINIDTLNCDAFVYLKFSVGRISDFAVKSAAEKLSMNHTIGDFIVVKAVPAEENSEPLHFLPSTPLDGSTQSDALSQREIIACIVAIVCILVLFLTFIVCCCVRYVCQKQTKSLDLCDIPHLNLKLEDYKLTPIPRPTISCPEYGRELFSTYNGRRSRTENTILSQHHFSGNVPSTMTATLDRDMSTCPQEMRTFSGKRPCSRVQSLDVRPNRGSNGWISSSREKLNADFERKGSGIDNAGFRKWF